MSLPAPYPGLVISYSYLWRREALVGQEEVAKSRPCAVVLASRDEEKEVVVTVLPITHSQPNSGTEPVEIPAKVKIRLGLDADLSWVVLSEVKRFTWPGPDLRPISRRKPGQFAYGALPPRLFEQVRAEFIAVAMAQRVRVVPRGQ